MPPMAGDTTLVTSPKPSPWIFSASALHRVSVCSAYWKTLAFCRNTGDRSPEDRMKCPSSMAPHWRKISRTSSFVITRTPVDFAVPLKGRDHACFAGTSPLDGGEARAALERCQNIGELRKVAHLDFKDHLVEVGRNHPHHQVIDIGVTRRDGRRNLRQRAGLVQRFHRNDIGE